MDSQTIETEDEVQVPLPSSTSGPGPGLYTPQVGDMFDTARTYMDTKRDKDEEIMRLSKDITWESKRIIYTLHRFMVYDKACIEGRKKIHFLLSSDRYFPGMGKALKGQDVSQHYKRYTNCVQEYVEATVFLHFLEERKIPKYEQVRDSLIFVDKRTKEEDGDEDLIVVPLSVTDYVLGVCDFTGELMKAAVQTLCKQKWHSFLCQAFAMVREIYSQFFGVYAYHREFKKKLNVMRASVLKIEATVYRLKIKVLVYGRIPDATELQMMEHSAMSGFRESYRGRDRGDNNRERESNDGGGGKGNEGSEGYLVDSGVE